jgi:hypothetical protein
MFLAQKKLEQVTLGAFGQFVVFTILSIVIFHYSCWRTFARTPKAPFLPFHTPQRWGQIDLPRQVEAEIYPKKDLKKVCKILGHSEGTFFVAQGGLTRMTCDVIPRLRYPCGPVVFCGNLGTFFMYFLQLGWGLN